MYYLSVQSLRNSYSLTDLSQSLEWSRGRFTDISEESRPGTRMDWAERSGGLPDLMIIRIDRETFQMESCTVLKYLS